MPSSYEVIWNLQLKKKKETCNTVRLDDKRKVEFVCSVLVRAIYNTTCAFIDLQPLLPVSYDSGLSYSELLLEPLCLSLGYQPEMSDSV